MASVSLYPSLIVLTLPELSEAFDTNISSLTIPHSLNASYARDLAQPKIASMQRSFLGSATGRRQKLDTVWVPVRMERQLPLTELWRKHGKKSMKIKLYNWEMLTAGVRLGNVSLGIGSIGQPPSEIFPRLRQLTVLHHSLGYCPRLFLPSLSLDVYDVLFHRTAPRSNLRNHVLHQIAGYHPPDRQ